MGVDLTGDVRGLTIRQPHASLICPGPDREPVKRIESARPKTSYRGWVLIHAGKERPKDGAVVGDWQVHRRVFGSIDSIHPRDRRRRVCHLPLGAVVGVARITDCVPVVKSLGGPDDPLPRVCVSERGLRLMRPFVYPSVDISDQAPYGVWTPGTHAYLLDDIVSLARPVPARGALGLWRPTPDVLAAVQEQLP